MAKKRKIGDVRNRILKGLREKPKSKKYFKNNQTGKKELAPPPGYVSEAKSDNDTIVQKQIKSGFGDMLSSDFKKKKKEMSLKFKDKKKKMGSSFENMKRRIEENKKRLGG